MQEEAHDSPQALNGLLRPTVTPTVAASLLPTRRFLLSKGTGGAGRGQFEKQQWVGRDQPLHV